MVLEKIVNQTDENQKQTYSLLQDQFQNLKDQSLKKDEQIHKFYEKIGEIDYLSGLVIKNKQIIIPTEQALAFKKQQEKMLDMLNLQQSSIKKLTQQRDKLIRINVHMKDQVEKKKDQVRNMTVIMNNFEEQYQSHNATNTPPMQILKQLEDEPRNNDYSCQYQSQRNVINKFQQINSSRSVINTTVNNNNSNNTWNFVKIQRQLIRQADEADEYNNSSSYDSDEIDCPELAMLFPDKVEQIKINYHQNKIPYLNMKKIRELMHRREQKMKKNLQADLTKHNINPTVKIIQLETQLEITRKDLTNIMLKYKVCLQQNKKINLYLNEIESRNKLLIQGIQKQINKYKIINKQYQQYLNIIYQIQKIFGIKINILIEQNNYTKNIKKYTKIYQNRIKQQNQQKNNHNYKDKLVREIMINNSYNNYHNNNNNNKICNSRSLSF